MWVKMFAGPINVGSQAGKLILSNLCRVLLNLNLILFSFLYVSSKSWDVAFVFYITKSGSHGHRSDLQIIQPFFCKISHLDMLVQRIQFLCTVLALLRRNLGNGLVENWTMKRQNDVG